MESCLICKNFFESTSYRFRLETCNHLFHLECLHRELGKDQQCPVCWKPLSDFDLECLGNDSSLADENTMSYDKLTVCPLSFYCQSQNPQSGGLSPDSLPRLVILPNDVKLAKQRYDGPKDRRHKCSTSYGLIVKTRCGGIVVLRRKIPYCVQNYLSRYLDRKKVSVDKYDFEAVRQDFETKWLPHLGKADQMDYERYRQRQIYEDLYDFPHGQLVNHERNQSNYQIFLSAYREFKEESGHRFWFTKSDVDKYPIVAVEFFGNDGYIYTQYFFIVENARYLRRHSYFESFRTESNKIESWTDDRLVYRGQVIKVKRARDKFLAQQGIKCDLKYLLCEKLDASANLLQKRGPIVIRMDKVLRKESTVLGKALPVLKESTEQSRVPVTT